MRALAKEPEQRYQTPAELVADYDALAPPPSDFAVTPRASPLPRRRCSNASASSRRRAGKKSAQPSSRHKEQAEAAIDSTNVAFRELPVPAGRNEIRFRFRPGILLWAIAGWKRLRQRGRFLQPKAGAETLRQMRELASKITAFVEDCCTRGPGLQVPVAELYSAFRTWCSANGIDKPSASNLFSRDLQAAYPQVYNQGRGLGFPIARLGALISLACGAVVNPGSCAEPRCEGGVK